MAAAAPRLLTAELREYVTRGDTPLRVDRAAGVIYGVKLLGKSSTNTHGVAGVSGTDYSPEAVRQAAPLYEGLKGNVNHPPREKPHQERSAYDRVCKYFNVREAAGELFSDLKLLKSHPMAGPLMDAAEDPDLNDCFALSHNALGKGEVRGGRYVITEIPEVRSVDVVADGGSNRSLRESKEPAMKKWKLCVAAADLAARTRLQPLLEMDDYGDMETADAGASGGWEEHLGNMIGAVIADAGMDNAEKIKKVVAAVKAMLKEEEAPEETEAEEGEEEEPAKDDDKDKAKDAKESKRLKRENAALKVCMEAGVTATPVQLKALTALGTDAEMKELAATLGGKGAGKGTSPKSQPPGGKPLTEGKVAPAKDAKDFARQITG